MFGTQPSFMIDDSRCSSIERKVNGEKSVREREWIDGVQRKRQKKGNTGRSRKHINNNDKRRLHETQVTNEDETMMLFFILSRSKRKNVFDLCIPFPQTRSLSCSILSSFNSTYFLAFFLPFCTIFFMLWLLFVGGVGWCCIGRRGYCKRCMEWKAVFVAYCTGCGTGSWRFS